MNSLIIVLIALALFFWAYRYYAKWLERLWQIDPKKATPAHTKYDSVDYIPAKNWLVLFGHHFASIAGAGPIIGPVMAVVLWGWLPAVLWVVIGTIFIGGVHDFGSLVTSVREGGSSVSDIAGHVISRRAKIIFSLFLIAGIFYVNYDYCGPAISGSEVFYAKRHGLIGCFCCSDCYGRFYGL